MTLPPETLPVPLDALRTTHVHALYARFRPWQFRGRFAPDAPPHGGVWALYFHKMFHKCRPTVCRCGCMNEVDAAAWVDCRCPLRETEDTQIVMVYPKAEACNLENACVADSLLTATAAQASTNPVSLRTPWDETLAAHLCVGICTHASAVRQVTLQLGRVLWDMCVRRGWVEADRLEGALPLVLYRNPADLESVLETVKETA